MARKVKEVLTTSGTDRRYTGYYSTPLPVAQYIFERLREINPHGKSVVDTCIGREELANPFLEIGLPVTGIDIFDHGGVKRAKFINSDFIGLYEQSKKMNFLEFSNSDYWIANPPYNCHEVDYIKSNKSHLKTVFPDVGVHNMYSMFISAMIDMAKDGAIIGIVTLDSFLTSKAHKDLRIKLLNNCIFHDIILCPTDLFLDQCADVRTCLLIIQKSKSIPQPNVKLLNRTLNKVEFYDKLKNKAFNEVRLKEILLNSEFDNQEFLIGVPDEIKTLFNNKRISQVYSCVTGISTGNDNKYISKHVKDGFTIPFYKNPGSRKFFCEPDGFLIDDFLSENKKVKNFMVRNIPLIFKPGITCSSMGVEFSACYLPPNVTFGVNPNIICDEGDVWWLLAYLNSNIAKYIVRGVITRTNMVTSGYISRLPLLKLSEKNKNYLSTLAKKAYFTAKDKPQETSAIIFKINEELYKLAGISHTTQKELNNFCENIIRMA